MWRSPSCSSGSTNRPFQKLEGCRRSAFESIDRPALRPLPPTRYELSRWKKARVNIDYCVEYDARIYSVPHALVGQRVDIRATTTTLEVLYNARRIVSHRRCYGPKGTATILEEHRPKSHRQYGDWPPSRVIDWAQSVGPNRSVRWSSASCTVGRIPKPATARAWH